MRKSRFTEEQIVGILQEYAAGAEGLGAVPQARHVGRHALQVEGQVWRLAGFELRRLKDLETENAELKRLLADAMLDNAGLKGLLAKNS